MKPFLKSYRFSRLMFTCLFICLANLAVCVNAFAGAPDSELDMALQTRKGPYLIFTGNNTQMKVMWQLDKTADCTIKWGSDIEYSSGSAKTKEYGNDHQHAFIIKKLKPAKKYYYKVSTPDSDHVGSFYAAPKEKAKKVNFFVYGDTRSFPHIHNEIAGSIISSYTENPARQTFSIFIGDMVTFGAEESNWDKEIFNPANTNIKKMMASLPMAACVGNHDFYYDSSISFDNKRTLFKKYFPYPFEKHTYWSFDYGSTHVVILDQYSEDFETRQLEWLNKDLESTKKPWKFVIFHEPGWSAGGDDAHQDNKIVQTFIQPLLEKYQVTAVFSGHNHYYARALVNGVYHITTGGGGAPLAEPNPYAPKVTTTSSTYHYCTIGIDDNTFVFKAIKPDGTIIDTFTLRASVE